jgi:hypothetical protein
MNSTTTRNQVLSAFGSSLVAFMDELIDQFPQESGLIFARILLKDQIPIETTMKNFVLKIEQNDGMLKKMIEKKDENFFLENNVFSLNTTDGQQYSIQGGTVNHFRNLWLSNLDDDDRLIMWKWFETFVVLAHKYQEAEVDG